VKHPLLLPADSTNARQRVDTVFRGAGLIKRIHGVIESSTARVLARYVEMGLGVALCSLSPALVTELQTGAYGHLPLAVREVTSLFGEEPVVIARRKGGHLPGHVDGFRKLTLSST